jgi:hypothetical protein
MIGHTPGPWIALPHEPDDDGFIIQPIQSKSTMAIIGEVYGGTMLPESAANGRVIAAAPELLDSLREIVLLTDRDTDIWNKARAAIAKAEGRA